MRKRDLKREWKIKGQVYTVHFRRKMPHRLIGFCDQETRTIQLLMGQPYEETCATLIHELLHAIDFEFDIKIPHHLIYKLELPLLIFIIENYIED